MKFICVTNYTFKSESKHLNNRYCNIIGIASSILLNWVTQRFKIEYISQVAFFVDLFTNLNWVTQRFKIKYISRVAAGLYFVTFNWLINYCSQKI